VRDVGDAFTVIDRDGSGCATRRRPRPRPATTVE
jgi:hypothetical protein